MKVIQAYKCEFCPRARAYITPSAVAGHEARCFNNPATHSCATCRFLKDLKVPIEKFGYYTIAWRCTAKKPGLALTTNCNSWAMYIYEDDPDDFSQPTPEKDLDNDTGPLTNEDEFDDPDVE